MADFSENKNQHESFPERSKTFSDSERIRRKNDEIRKEALKKRSRIKDRPEKEKALVNNLMPFFKQARRPGFFIPIRSEPNIDRLLKTSPGFLAPKVISDTEMIFFSSEHLKEQAFGIMEPFSPEIEDLLENRLSESEEQELKNRYVPDVMLVPLSAFCQTNRMGYGAGYYDRYLQKHPDILTIGVAFDEQEADFEAMPWDQPLDLIVTPTRIIRKDNQAETEFSE